MKLSLIEAEARRLLGKLPERKLRACQRRLVELSETHWAECRGPEPATPLARALWSVCPPLAELYVDLYAVADPRLQEVLDRLTPAQALALLLLAELERGDAEGARIAYEVMRWFESPETRQLHTEAVRARLWGRGPQVQRRRKHPHRHPLARAVAALAVATRRFDSKALVEAIRLLALAQRGRLEAPPDHDLQRLLDTLQALGLAFQGVEGDRIHYTLHGAEKEPIARKHLADLLAEIRQSP